jgi:hypothetical protein
MFGAFGNTRMNVLTGRIDEFSPEEKRNPFHSKRFKMNTEGTAGNKGNRPVPGWMGIRGWLLPRTIVLG